jgi:NAD(P)-dependent dehydrogenase (short-subunit alcohol dehydrogenase family)
MPHPEHPANAPRTSEEVVEAILFLGSRRSAYITGHILSIDGGGLRGL